MPMKFLLPQYYQSECQAKFMYYKSLIQARLPQTRVEHIGSSAVPGMVSKGDLDIMVLVSKNALEESAASLKDLGFLPKEDTLRTPELCMLESRVDQQVAIQMVAQGSKYRFFIDFRDALLTNSELLDEYNALKMCFEGQPELDYRRAKSEFIEQALKANGSE